MTHKKIKQVDDKSSFDKRIRSYFEREARLLESLELSKRTIVNFRGGQPSFMGRVALAALAHFGGFIDVEFTNLKK